MSVSKTELTQLLIIYYLIIKDNMNKFFKLVPILDPLILSNKCILLKKLYIFVNPNWSV